ncbi:hypothetical protein F4780DRAFT_774734 [Xylariomycetidae sp. FL0641]|nr:hypothetical protein F4780DRAFT_774734 [Xylariomycetidae sp. FL0641]
MAIKESGWTGEIHESLVVALSVVIGTGFTPEQKETIVNVMKQRGHPKTWEAIRAAAFPTPFIRTSSTLATPRLSRHTTTTLIAPPPSPLPRTAIRCFPRLLEPASSSTIHHQAQVKMPSTWDEAANALLFQTIYMVVNPPISPEQKEAIVASLNAQGQDVKWNGIR